MARPTSKHDDKPDLYTLLSSGSGRSRVTGRGPWAVAVENFRIHRQTKICTLHSALIASGPMDSRGGHAYRSHPLLELSIYPTVSDEKAQRQQLRVTGNVMPGNPSSSYYYRHTPMMVVHARVCVLGTGKPHTCLRRSLILPMACVSESQLSEII